MSTRRSISRRHFAFGSAAIAGFALTSRHAGATSTGVRIVNANGLRLRTGPGLGHSVITSLTTGTEVIYLGPAGTADGYEWAHVELFRSSSTKGYVAAKYLSSPSGGRFPIGSTFHVDTAGGAGANLRSRPSISARVVRVISYGRAGTIQSAATNADGYAWYRVTIGGSEGWMASVVMAPG